MKKIPLAKFVEKHGQEAAAQAIGVSQGAISKALRRGREIYLVEQPGGSYRAYEIKPVGKAA